MIYLNSLVLIKYIYLSFKDLMKKLIDHDLIDLTMIPPPMTPDEV